MRGWGVTFIATTVGCVFLPAPLAFILIAVVISAGAVALATTYAEHRERIRAFQALDTGKTMDYLEQIKSMDDDVEHEWAKILGATSSDRPLVATPPERLRTIGTGFPAQRLPGDRS